MKNMTIKLKIVCLTVLMMSGALQAMDSNVNQNLQLIGAAEQGNMQQIEELLAQDADVDAQDEHGYTALIWAAINGHREICELLIAHQIDINTQGKDGWTALMYAARDGRLQIVQLLLERGASVTIANNDHNTALMLAEYYSHVTCCDLLIVRLMKIPNDAQRKKIYWLLLHMRKSGLGRDIYFIMKPYLLRIIEEENKENPQDSIALQEIRKCTNIGLVWPAKTKQDLLAKYGPKNHMKYVNRFLKVGLMLMLTVDLDTL